MDVHESYLVGVGSGAAMMSTSTSTSSDDEKLATRTSGKIMVNQKMNKSSSFSRRDSLNNKKQQQMLIHQQQQQELAAAIAREQEQQKQHHHHHHHHPSSKQIDLLNEPDVDVILNAPTTTEIVDSIVEAPTTTTATIDKIAADSETELSLRKVLEWHTAQTIDAQPVDKIEISGVLKEAAIVAGERDPAVEEEEEEEIKESKRAEQALLFSDSILDKMDKSIANDFMSSMQESNDDEELYMLKSRTLLQDEDTGVKSMSADEIDGPSMLSMLSSPTSRAAKTSAFLLTTASENEACSGAKSDNEAFIKSKSNSFFDHN